MTTRTRQEREAEGRKAEDHVARYLRLRGWKLLDQRFKTSEGEVDLIAIKGKIIAFVEVKQREKLPTRDDLVTASNERRLMAAAEIWVNRNFTDLPPDFEIRFDLAVIEGRVRPLSKVSYSAHAFRGDW
ncbi:YraN family protein [Litorimonas sp. WD9-15]|uniref:YraN family protein n=1 Tax=Litorimonas sp. WD9-15 TaxID=3418716 RepID=UPI003CFF81C3